MTFTSDAVARTNLEFGPQVQDEIRRQRSSDSASSRSLGNGEDLQAAENGEGVEGADVMKEFTEKTIARVESTESTKTPDGSMTEKEGSETENASDAGDGEGKPVPEELNPWSKDLIGIPINYFSVGVIYAGSVSILYPILVIQNGVDASFFAAAVSLVTLFWSFKIFFGLLCDTLPIFGHKWKPYVVIGWVLCAAMLVVLASMGDDVSPTTLVLMLTLANLGYVCADVAADGFMVWIAHQEADSKRGRVQTLIYIAREVGRICINVVIICGFSGPQVNCPGYESDPNVPCTTDESIMARNELSEEYPEDWCHMKCSGAQFDFGMTIPQYAWLIAAINLISIPSYFMLKEEKKERIQVTKVLSDFWYTAQRRAVWQVMLYTMISSITFNVFIAAKTPANYVWVGLSTLQHQVLSIVESFIFAAGLSLIRKYCLGFSWRKMMWIGSIMVTFFNCLYLLIVYDVIRNPWFYMFTDVSDTFLYTLNFLASVFCIVEISEPGFEAITYSLITTANNAIIPLSVVISYQFMAFFPDLNTQDGIASDTPAVRNQFALLILITESINLTSLLSLPMLPRQKEETRELMENGGRSKFWAAFTLISGLLFLIYSTVVTFMTVAGADTYGCLKILGGRGCTEDESDGPVIFLMCFAFAYCYGINFYFTFWPIIKGEKKFSWGVFF